MPFLNHEFSGLIPQVLTTVAKLLVFMGSALVIGLWVLPWLLGRLGGLKTRELFLMSVLVLALGTMVATYQFGLPSVFGAFLTGLLLRRLKYSEQAIAEITPFRDVFVAIFFVSLGMLLNLDYVIKQWNTLIVLLPVIIAVKFGIVFLVTWRFGFGKRVAILCGAALYHIGEFGFIIAQSGLSTGLISGEQFSLIVSSAILSMLLMPFSMSLAAWATRKVTALEIRQIAQTELAKTSTYKNGFIILAGYGRVGSNIAAGLKRAGLDFLVIELDPNSIAQLRKKGLRYIYGDCSNGLILTHAGLEHASTLVITYPDEQAVERTISNALRIKPNINIIARAHRLKDANLMKGMGVKELISPEFQASQEFLKRTLVLSGYSESEIDKIIHSI
jgi:CPA2 family monovalent cation:H+ antiporter-2